MINFIIAEDDKKFRGKVERIITSCMMKNELEYEMHLFDDCDDKFLDVVNKRLSFKIYILDIEMPSGSGIDMARIIRNKDTESIIIFLTGHQELGQIVMENDFLFLSFINKFDDYESRLEKSLTKALKILKVKKAIKFKDSGISYTISLDDILYITKDSIERKSIIKTDYTEFKIGKSLNEIQTMLDSFFIKTHRACIINKRRVASYNKTKRIITFDNGATTDLISTRFEGELM